MLVILFFFLGKHLLSSLVVVQVIKDAGSQRAHFEDFENLYPCHEAHFSAVTGMRNGLSMVQPYVIERLLIANVGQRVVSYVLD